MCLLCCGCAHFHTDMDRAGAYHNKAIMASRRGDYEAAVLLMDSSLAIYDGSPSGWAARAHFEEKLGDDEAALANYSRSIERIEAFPVTRNRYVLSLHADIYYARSEVRKRLGDTAGAGKDLLKVEEYEKRIERSFWWKKPYYWITGE